MLDDRFFLDSTVVVGKRVLFGSTIFASATTDLIGLLVGVVLLLLVEFDMDVETQSLLGSTTFSVTADLLA